MRKIILPIILLLCLPMMGQIESYLTYRRYTTQDGLPQMQTEKIWQDSQGYIYIGTLSGFVRFDGKAFTPFLKGQRYNIVGFVEKEGSVRALDFRRQWFTSYNGVEMLPIDPEWRWLLNNFNGGSLPDDYVLLEDEQEKNRRLCRVTREGFQPVVKGGLLDRMTRDRKIWLDSTGLYVPAEQGLYIVPRGAGFPKRAKKLSDKQDIFTLLRTEKDLFAFAKDGIYTVSDKGVTQKKNFDFKAPDYGIIARQQKDGRLILADSHTLYEYDGEQVREIASGFKLIKDVYIDKWNRLWVATYEGLYCFFNRGFTNHRLTDGDDIVRALCVDGKDRLVMGTLNGKLLVDGNLVANNPKEYYAPSAVTIDGSVYLAGSDKVIQICQGNIISLLLRDHYQFVGKSDGKLIVGSRKCVAAYNLKTGVLDTLSTDIPYPWCAVEDNYGRLWVGSTFGLYVDGQKVDYPQKLIVTTMESDRHGNLLFASKDSLFMIRDGQIVSLNMPGLSGHEVRSLHVSPKGYLVVAVIDGLFVSRITRNFIIGDTRFFDHTNGFTALEPLMAMMAETSDGTVWLAGVEEMTSFRPAALLEYQPECTYIAPPLRWWEHWWVLLIAVMLLSIIVWGLTRWIEKRRSRRKIFHLERAKQEKDRQISAIRQKAIEAEQDALAKDIVKMTEETEDTRLAIRTVNGIIITSIADIAFFKADGNYTKMVTFQRTETILTGIGKLEKTLNPQIFVRADRSTLVNIHNINYLDAKKHICTFKSVDNKEVETTLLTPAFKRLESLL